MPKFTISAAISRPCTLVVCRGCCCGDARKTPGTDHARQLDRLRTAAARSGGRIAVRTTDCLGPCGQANVIVVQPSGRARQRGARAAWVGWVLDDYATDDIVAWAEQGGPGVADPSPTLALQMIPAPAEARRRAR
ncbi:(2Fe-2S) ferredoxin domain-containing protein [Streptomyces sp. NPDC048361]|uniref:(2Fe-2S) ferredoxin domain-containing protein n=1 Tax=Streptomyces sp. NPDC048361 TaxID=3154720 RepID=UPI003426A5CA